jgi:glycosyltransferase involved in cell wall biosynthesis
MVDITVITPTIEGREKLLEEAIQSVKNQTLPAVHLFGLDYRHMGVAAMRNQLIDQARTEWVAFLDDDDVMYPNHLEVLAKECEEADVVYSDCDLVTVRDGKVEQYLDKPWKTRPFVLEEIKHRNYIPVTALVRRTWMIAKPFRPVPTAADWDLWIQLGEAGARFKYVPEITWMYRRHAGNGTSGGSMHLAVPARGLV